MEESFWKRLWTCRQTEYWIIIIIISSNNQVGLLSSTSAVPHGMTASRTAQQVTLLTSVLEVPGGKMTTLIEGFCDIPQSLQISAGIVPYLRLRPLPSTFFPVYYSLNSLSSIHWTQYNALLTTSLHKLQITLQNISYVRDFHGGEDLRVCSEASSLTYSIKSSRLMWLG